MKLISKNYKFDIKTKDEIKCSRQIQNKFSSGNVLGSEGLEHDWGADAAELTTGIQKWSLVKFCIVAEVTIVHT